VNSRLLVLALIILFFFATPVAASDIPKAQASIVQIRAVIPADARTAGALGRHRTGSGVVIDANGYILTIGYLIIEAESIEIILPNGRSAMATYVGYDHATGFGLIKTERTKGLVPVELGRSAKVNVGDPVLLVGYGGAAAIQPSNVIIRSEFAGYWEYLLEEAFYVAPPHPEFAGTAMLDAEGRLMGIGSIYTQLVMPRYGALPCNMFVPIDLLKPILNDMIATGRAADPPKPWLGVNAEESHGRVFISRVHGEGPAQQAGLRERDIVLNVDGVPVTGLADFYRKVWALGQAGVQVPLTLLQGNDIKEINVRSSDRYQYLRIRPTLKAPRAIIEKAI
jgi:S1-C subfamily serine protease